MRIKDALKFGGLKDGKVVAGESGLDNHIDMVSVLEVTEIDNANQEARWMYANQLYVTAFYAIKDDVDAQVRLIHLISETGGSGIALCHIDFWVKRLDPSVIEACNQLRIPLIVMPSDTAYTDIIIPINDRLLKVYSERYKYSLDIQSQLNELIIANRDINDIGAYVSKTSGSCVLILDVNYNILSNTCFSENLVGLLQSYCKSHFADFRSDPDSNKILKREIEGTHYYIHPVISGQDYFGLIVLDENPEKIVETENLHEIIKYTGIAMALISTKKQRIEKMQDLYFRDYLSDLLTWNFRDEQIALTRGDSIQWDIRNKKMLVIFNINSAYDNRDLSAFANSVEAEVQTILPRFLEVVKEDHPKNLAGYRSDQIIIFLEDDQDEHSMLARAKKLAARLLEETQRDFKFSISIGVSAYFQKASSIADAYKEATYALNLGRDISGDYATYCYSELGFIPYFGSKAFDDVNSSMRARLLEPLISYDEEHNSDLVNTLKNLLFYNQNFSYISEMMFIHRNTLLARKKKIIEILKLDPFEMPNTVNYLILLTQMSMDQ